MRLSAMDEQSQAIQRGSLGVDRRREQGLSDDPRRVQRSQRLGEELEPATGLVVRKRIERSCFPDRRPVVAGLFRDVEVGLELGLVAGGGVSRRSPMFFTRDRIPAGVSTTIIPRNRYFRDTATSGIDAVRAPGIFRMKMNRFFGLTGYLDHQASSASLPRGSPSRERAGSSIGRGASSMPPASS